MPKSITIVGNGRVGGTLARALAAAGYRIDPIIVRHRRGRKQANLICWSDSFEVVSDIVIVATRDDEISGAARSIAERLASTFRPVVFHTSGALSSEVLGELRDAGCAVGSLHPLISVSRAGGRSVKLLAKAFFCLEGDAAAVAAGAELVAGLGGRSFSIAAGTKPLYHASAVTACGHLVALFDVALEMFEGCGLERTRARAVLLPLVESTVANLKDQDTGAALTGPFARGDGATVAGHLKAFEGTVSPNAVEVYIALAVRSAELAAAAGLDAERANAIGEIISMAKSKG